MPYINFYKDSKSTNRHVIVIGKVLVLMGGSDIPLHS